MELGSRAGRALGAILTAFILASAVPPTPVSAASDRSILPARADATAQLQRLGVPSGLIDLLSVDQSVTFSGSYVDVIRAGDLNSDGMGDVVAGLFRYEVTLDESGNPLAPPVSEKFHTRLRATSGKDGSAIWTKNFDDGVWPVPARVGKNGSPGLFLFHGLATWLGPIQDREVTIDAVNGASGRRIWRKAYRSVASQSHEGQLYVGVPTGIDHFDGLPGKSTDLLVGVGDIAGTWQAYVTRTTTLVLDGKDGTETRHPAQDVGVNWLPSPWAVPDVGAARFDDYVVPSDKGVALPEQGAPQVGGILTARTGDAGEQLWTEGGYEFTQLAWVYKLGDVVGDSHRDIGVVTIVGGSPSPLGIGFFTGAGRWVTYLTDAGAGIRRWRKPLAWPYSPGDFDGDGKDEVVTRDTRWRHDKGEIAYVQQAYDGQGRQWWHRSIERRYDRGPCPMSCGAGYGSGWWEVGDLQQDRRTDTFVQNSISQDPGGEFDFNFTISGRTGRVVDSGGAELQAFGAAIDGRGTDVVDLEASGTDLRLDARSGDADRLLWRSELTFDTLFGSDASRRLTHLTLDRDRCDDVIAIIDSPKATIVVALDGGSGRVKWQRTIDGGARILDSTVSDRLHRC